MTLALLFLIALGVTSIALAAYTFVGDRRRHALMQRALGTTDAEVGRRSALLGAAKRERRRASVLKQLPTGLENSRFTQKLVYAGHDGPMAPAIFAAVRLATLIVIPTAVGLALLSAPMPVLLVMLPGATLIAWILPIAVLGRLLRARQDRI